MSRLVAAPPPNRVRSPTDRQFASGCSPRRFEPTQLPLASELWHTPARTFTVLMWRPHRRRHSLSFADIGKKSKKTLCDISPLAPHGFFCACLLCLIQNRKLFRVVSRLTPGACPEQSRRNLRFTELLCPLLPARSAGSSDRFASPLSD